MVQVEEVKEERQSCQVVEVEFFQDKVVNEVEGDIDLEVILEVRFEKEFMGERSEEEVQMDREVLGVEWGGFEYVISEGQEFELIGGFKILIE